MNAKWLKDKQLEIIGPGLIFIVCGIILICFPGSALQLVCTIIGGAFFGAGTVQILNYIFNLMNLDAYHYVRGYQLVQGCALLGVGIFCFLKSKFLISLVPILLGIGILFSGIGKLQQALDLKKLGFTGWIGLMMVSVICIVCGGLVLFNPFSSARLLVIYVGIWMVISGVTDLISNRCLTNRLRELEKLAEEMDQL